MQLCEGPATGDAFYYGIGRGPNSTVTHSGNTNLLWKRVGHVSPLPHPFYVVLEIVQLHCSV